MNKVLHGYWLTFEMAKDRYNVEPSMVSPECIDWYNKRIFFGRIYDEQEPTHSSQEGKAGI